MKKQKLSDVILKYRIHLVLFIAAVTSILLVIFIIYPQTVKLLELNSQQQDLVNKIDRLEDKITLLEAVDEGDIKDKLNLTLLALPIEQDLFNFIGFTQTIATQDGFNLVSVQFGSESMTTRGNSYIVKAAFIGPKQFVKKFLADLEQSYRSVVVEQLELTQIKSLDTVNGAITMRVYYAPLPTTLGQIDSPIQSLTAEDEQVLINLSKLGVNLAIQSNQLVPRGKPNPFE